MAEPIYAPTCPGDGVTFVMDIDDTLVHIPLNLQADGMDAGPVMVDDSPAALIARLTAGDRP